MIMIISHLCFNEKNPWGVNDLFWVVNGEGHHTMGGILGGGNGGPPEMGVLWDL